MEELDYLNYRPNLKRDVKEKTSWTVEKPSFEEESDSENNYQGKDKEITETLESYEDFKKDFSERVEKLEKDLQDIEIVVNEDIERALEDTGHESIFTPDSFRELFKKKETSPGEYLVGVLEKEIEGENGTIDWEIFIEYLEMEEEISVLDYYIEEILYPLLKKDNKTTISIKDIEKLEEAWIDKIVDIKSDYFLGEYMYQVAMVSSADEIPKRRDELHDYGEKDLVIRQEMSQSESSLTTIQQKQGAMEYTLKDIDRILNKNINEETLIDDIVELTNSQNNADKAIHDTVILLKQSIDDDNHQKRELKNTRRNIYSQSKQERIINEYSTINHLYRENSLNSLHYMKSFQDNANEQLNKVFNQSAKSIKRNFNENNEKTYESFLLQISTSQNRMKRLEWVSSKQESRLIFKNIKEEYK